MPKKDFVMQIIAQLRGLLPYILDLVKAGNYDEAHAVIDQAVREIIGIGTDGLLNLPPGVVLARLQADPAGAWDEKGLFLATVLFEEGEILTRREEEAAAYGRYLYALELLLAVAGDNPEPLPESDLIPDIDRLLALLADYHLPAETCVNLMAYYEGMGDFTAVENVLFDWLENTPAELYSQEVDPAQAGMAFFERLLLLPAAELEAGGLTREEVVVAVADLRELEGEASSDEMP